MSCFYTAREAMGPIAERAEGDPDALADRVYEALLANGVGRYDGLIRLLTPALVETGLARLKSRMIALGDTPVEPPAEHEREVVSYGMYGPTFTHEMAERWRRSVVELALKDIADIEGDMNAYIAQYDAETAKRPKVTARIAERLVA